MQEQDTHRKVLAESLKAQQTEYEKERESEVAALKQALMEARQQVPFGTTDTAGTTDTTGTPDTTSTTCTSCTVIKILFGCEASRASP
jgi:hypothetical protein